MKKVLPALLLALIFLMPSHLHAQIVIKADEPLMSSTLGGIWNRANVAMRRSSSQSSLNWRSIDHLYRFKYLDSKTVALSKYSSGKDEFIDKTDMVLNFRDEFSIRLSSNRASLRKKWPFYSLELLYSKNGVDTLQDGDGIFFVRFQSTPAAIKAKFGDLTFNQFCNGPARQLAEVARKELEIAERLTNQAKRVYGDYDVSRGAALGMFASPVFEKLFSEPYDYLDDQAQIELLERLKHCAILMSERTTADTLGTALLWDFGRRSIQGFLQLRSRSFRDPVTDIRRDRRRGHIVGMLIRMQQARKQLRAVAEPADGTAPDKAQIAEVLSKNFQDLLPSEVAQAVLAREATQAQTEARERREREIREATTGPDLPESTLILNATRDYMVANCDRAILAMRTAAQGNNPLAILAANSVTPRGDLCVVETPTHLLEFNVNSVSLKNCSPGKTTTCTFLANWFCRFRLNPKFGFSSNTPNVDVLCPVIRRLPVEMQGVFAKQYRRKWTASSVNW